MNIYIYFDTLLQTLHHIISMHTVFGETPFRWSKVVTTGCLSDISPNIKIVLLWFSLFFLPLPIIKIHDLFALRIYTPPIPPSIAEQILPWSNIHRAFAKYSPSIFFLCVGFKMYRYSPTFPICVMDPHSLAFLHFNPGQYWADQRLGCISFKMFPFISLVTSLSLPSPVFWNATFSRISMFTHQ